MLTKRTGPPEFKLRVHQRVLSTVFCMALHDSPAATNSLKTEGNADNRMQSCVLHISAYTDSAINTLDQPNARSEPARTVTRTGLFTSIWCSCKASGLHRDAPKALPTSCLQAGTLTWSCLVFSNARRTRSKF